MKVISLFLVFLACAYAQTIAVAYLYGTAQDPTVTGWVKFTQTGNGVVTVSVNLTGITSNPNNMHGIHVHAIGDISDETASLSTGGHFNPFGAPHGCPENGTARHVGDMGSFQATNGVIVATKTLDLLQLTGNVSIVGRAVVLHQDFDDCVNVSSYGSRLAHGVIGIVNPVTYGATNESVQQSTNLIPSAICVLKPSSGSNVTGTVWFFQATATSPVDVYAKVSGISSEHGFHLHVYGDISSPAGLATGGHYNPLNDVHGVPPAIPRHKGDMGIIYYYDTGVAYYRYSNDLLTLNGLYNVIGRAVHVHSGSDDCTNPIGNGGARIAQCVIGATTTVTPPTFPVGVPTTQNGTTICSITRGTSASSMNSNSASATNSNTNSNSDTGSDSGVATLFASLAIVFAMLFLNF